MMKNLANAHYDLVCYVNDRFELSDVVTDADINAINWYKVLETIYEDADEDRREELDDGAFFSDDEIREALRSIANDMQGEVFNAYDKIACEL